MKNQDIDQNRDAQREHEQRGLLDLERVFTFAGFAVRHLKSVCRKRLKLKMAPVCAAQP